MSELVTDEMVETAAATSWAHDHSMPWDMAPSDVRDYYLDDARDALEAVAPLIAAKALWDAAETYTVTILDALGYKVQAVFTEDLMDRAAAIEAALRSD